MLQEVGVGQFLSMMGNFLWALTTVTGRDDIVGMETLMEATAPQKGLILKVFRYSLWERTFSTEDLEQRIA